MKRLEKSLVTSLVLVSAALSGCAPRQVGFGSLASHTLRVAPDQDADVVWVLKVDSDGTEVTETILRCMNTSAGPACTPAKGATQ